MNLAEMALEVITDIIQLNMDTDELIDCCWSRGGQGKCDS